MLKEEDPLLKTNYRPASILPTVSKVFEKVLNVQLSDYLDGIFNNTLCAFSKDIGCQTILLRLLEDWEKKAFDQNLHVAAILIDLSEGFDCLPHDIVLSKLTVYSLSPNSISVLRSYSTDRYQQVNLHGVFSS